MFICVYVIYVYLCHVLCLHLFVCLSVCACPGLACVNACVYVFLFVYVCSHRFACNTLAKRLKGEKNINKDMKIRKNIDRQNETIATVFLVTQDTVSIVTIRKYKNGLCHEQRNGPLTGNPVRLATYPLTPIGNNSP